MRLRKDAILGGGGTQYSLCVRSIKSHVLCGGHIPQTGWFPAPRISVRLLGHLNRALTPGRLMELAVAEARGRSQIPLRCIRHVCEMGERREAGGVEDGGTGVYAAGFVVGGCNRGRSWFVSLLPDFQGDDDDS